jgi:hypothetical protein
LRAPRAAAAAISTAIAVPQLVTGSGDHHAPAATARAAAGTPAFLVELATEAKGQLFVQQTGTKRITTRIPAPGGASMWDAVAADGETTFIAAASTGSGGVFAPAFYRLTLSADGKLGQLTKLRSGIWG